jgi:2-methylisocitrate lyase-like PEP mutase family enzyme
MDAGMQQQLAARFHELHQTGNPLVLFNAWDVVTAKAIARSAPAIATSSGAVASALGFTDGENVPLDIVVGMVSRLTAAVPVPVSVDIEAGYGDTPEAAAASVARIVDAGAVGINIEDGLGGGKRQLVDAAGHAAKIAAVRAAAERLGVRLFINARTDPFLLKTGTPEQCLDEAVGRAKLYGEAGADGVFIPGLTDLTLIEQLVGRVTLPVNIMVMSPAVVIADLARAGVRRISLGPWPMMATMSAIGETVATLVATGRYEKLLQPTP